MAVTEPQRLALHKAACEALGDEEGDTLMALTPPANTEIATRQDLERIGERLDTRIVSLEERLDGKMNSLEERLNFRMDSLETRLNAKMKRLEELLSAQMKSLETRLNARMDSLEERLDAKIINLDQRLRTHTWKVVVGTGLALYVAMSATMFAGAAFLLQFLDLA